MRYLEGLEQIDTKGWRQQQYFPFGSPQENPVAHRLAMYEMKLSPMFTGMHANLFSELLKLRCDIFNKLDACELTIKQKRNQ
jgi:hypothetical protein